MKHIRTYYNASKTIRDTKYELFVTCDTMTFLKSSLKLAIEKKIFDDYQSVRRAVEIIETVNDCLEQAREIFKTMRKNYLNAQKKKKKKKK